MRYKLVALVTTNLRDGTVLEACKHENLPVKYDAADCAGKDEWYVREKYPRFYGPCPGCGQVTIGYASFEHYIAGDW